MSLSITWRSIMKYSICFVFFIICICFFGCSKMSEENVRSQTYNNIDNQLLIEEKNEQPIANISLSDTTNYGLPKCTNSSKGKEWTVNQTLKVIKDFKGAIVEKGIYVVSRTDPVDKIMPAGGVLPSLHIGDEQSGNYDVSFDYCIPDNGNLAFMLFDESDTIFVNEQLGEEGYWYELFANGRFDLCTTFGQNSKHILDSNKNFITVLNYDSTIWNHCMLNITDIGTEVFINDELITVLEILNNKKNGRLALDGSRGIMFKNFKFNQKTS